MKSIIFAAVVAATLPLAPAYAAVNLVTNGGFETTSRPGNFEFGNTAGAAGTVTGWTSASTTAYNLLFNSATANTTNAAGTYQGTGNEYMWASTASSQGGNFVALDGDSDVRGALTQMITGLTVGQTYTLSFEWSAGQLRSRTGATTEQLAYSLGGTTFNTSVVNVASQGTVPWVTVTRNFTATSTSELLSFLSIGTPNGLPPMALLDNVSLTTSVPEPATWGMMIIGFGLMGGSMRYRRRNISAAIA